MMHNDPMPTVEPVVILAPVNGLGRIFTTEPIAWVEAFCAFAILMRAIWMLYFGGQALDIQGYLLSLGWTEIQWGLVHAVLGASQAILIRWRWRVPRVIIGTLTMLVLLVAVGAYYTAGVFNRAVVPLLIVILVGEMLMAGEAWSELWKVLFSDRRQVPRA